MKNMKTQKVIFLSIVVGFAFMGLQLFAWAPESNAGEISSGRVTVFGCALENPETTVGIKQVPAPETRPITKQTRRAVIEITALALRESYFDAETAEAMAAELELKFARGDYNNIDDACSLAKQLSDDLHSVSDDKHLHLIYRPHRDKEIEPESFENHGFAQIELIDSKIGYLEILTMAHGTEARVVAAEAMTSLSEAQSLVLDLRKNRGGAASMTDFLCSHLFEEKTLLYTLERRMDGMKRESWTNDVGSGHRFPENIPVYILVSKDTFSAAEGLAYILQQHGRAKIVGETTGGGAHPNMWRALPADFEISIPFMRVIHPVTGSDWEGDGVKPDFPCDSAAALEVALHLAGKSLQ